MEPLDDKNTAQLLQQMRRQTEIRPEQEESSGSGSSHTGTFRIRLALAGVLLLTIILLDQKGKCFAGISMDQENKSFAGLSMDQVLSYVTEVDYGTYIETWMENAVNDLQAL